MAGLLRSLGPRVLRTLCQCSQKFGVFSKTLGFIDVTRVLRTLSQGSENFAPQGSQNPGAGFSEVWPGVLRSRCQNLGGDDWFCGVEAMLRWQVSERRPSFVMGDRCC